MLLFGRKKTEKEEVKALVKSDAFVAPNISKGSVSAIIRPRITEKTTMLAKDKNTYTFNVEQDATIADVDNAIKTIYKVNPIDIRFSAIPRKSLFTKGKSGKKGGGKKSM